jgi:TRAP-type C4-dicarboxylate transport system permease small subunit
MDRGRPLSKAVKFFSAIETLVAQINTSLVAVCGVVFLLYMFYTVSDVTGRYLFLKPAPGTYELGEATLTFMVVLSWAFLLRRNEHIKVRVILDRLSPLWRAWLELLVLALGFSLTFLMAWHSLPFALRSYEVNEVGLVFPMPFYIGKFAFFVGCTMFCIQFFIQLIRHIFTKLIGITTGRETS